MLELSIVFKRPWFRDTDPRTNFVVQNQKISDIPFGVSQTDLRKIIEKIQDELNHSKEFNHIWESNELTLFVCIKLFKSAICEIDNDAVFVSTSVEMQYKLIKNAEFIVLYTGVI